MVEHIITSEAEENKFMHATCKAALKSVNRNGDNCPILMEKMTFNILSHYMPMKKRKNSGVYPYAASYGGIRISLTHMYCVSGKDMDQEFKKELSQLMSGMKRVISSNKRKSVINIDEGKKAMSFGV